MTRRPRALPVVLLAALALVACGGGSGEDAGAQMDAGPDTDGGGVVDAGAVDAGGVNDDAGGMSDAGSVGDGGGSDGGPAGDAAAPSCDPDAVRYLFLASGPFEEGTLCDDVFVCARSAAEQGRVVAASSRFECSNTPEGACTGGTCTYRDPGGPGTLDADELREICAVTLVTPTPDVVCVVYGP